MFTMPVTWKNFSVKHEKSLVSQGSLLKLHLVVFKCIFTHNWPFSKQPALCQRNRVMRLVSLFHSLPTYKSKFIKTACRYIENSERILIQKLYANKKYPNWFPLFLATRESLWKLTLRWNTAQLTSHVVDINRCLCPPNFDRAALTRT